MSTILLHNITNNIAHAKMYGEYNLPNEIRGLDDLLTFDGIYKNVYTQRSLLTGKDVILFVMGKYVGGDNSEIDPGRPVETFCDWNEIMELVTGGCKLGWHTWSHPDLTKLSDEDLTKEVTPPFPMDFFAYPYGKFDNRVIEAVKLAGYKGAYGVNESDGTEWTIPRKYL